MSFVTKRERVFKDDIDLYELPPRNEGKLKAYASCTDARAWSHFYSDQSEHLVDLIKRNNTSCAPKYVPTKVIVDTIMSQKNWEISRLRQKIDTLDQMLAVYDQLELDCGQKCEIARAHESIKAASRGLDEVCLDLDMDLSGFTEGLESDVYETGKSRGDEIEKSKGDMSIYSRVTPPHMESKAVQKTAPPSNDAGTVVYDPRIDEMRDEIIFKDAKLNAMQNSMAVLENDVCEPYCIYAHIYTALEKIYGILYQNDTYRQYLELLSAGKDTRCLDIKGRILFKMKVLEKFALALVAPCSKKFADEAQKENAECDCGRSKIVARVETTYALTSSESQPPPTSDSKRAHLVAEIMDSDEMKEILERDPFISDGLDTDNAYCGLNCYSIDAENVKRLKDLQKSYDELMECFENLKHEKDCLQVRCRKYNELEMEVETLREQLASCNALWSEKERFRKRSADLEDINDKYLILQNVSENLQSELRAEREIKNNKMQVIEDLRKENLILERKLSDATIAFEKEKNALLCKLKEFECALSCKDQEVKSLSEQFQKHFDDNQERESDSIKTFSLLNDIELLKEELNSTKGLLNCCEEEKQHIKDEFQNKLSLINDLRMEIEDWKGTYEDLLAQKNFMETQLNDEMAELEEQNINLNKKMDEKTKAISNLMEMISQKSMEINTLFEEISNTKQENEQMMSELLDLRNKHSIYKESLETENIKVQELLDSERKKSKQLEAALHSDHLPELLHDEVICKKSERPTGEVDSLRGVLDKLSKENHLIHEKFNNREYCHEDVKQQYERLKDDFKRANEIIFTLKDEKRECEISKIRLLEELNNWKQKFNDLERRFQKFHRLGGEKYDDLSHNNEEAESSSWKQYLASNSKRENVPRSFDKASLIDSELKEFCELLIAKELASPRFSVVNENNITSSFPKITTQNVLKSQEKTGQSSYDKNTSHLDPEIPDNINENAMHRDSRLQDQIRFQLFDEKSSFRDLDSQGREVLLKENISLNSNHQEKKILLETEIQLSEKIFQQDLEPQNREELLSFNDQTMRFNAELQDEKPTPSVNESGSQHEHESQLCTSLLSDIKKNTALEFGVQIKGSILEVESTKHNIDYKPTSHDLKPLEQARSSAGDKVATHKHSRSQEKDLISSSKKENEKTEATESLNKKRRYSSTQYDSFGEIDQHKCESEGRMIQKMDLEGQNYWQQKYYESERERHEKNSSLQYKDIELNVWKEKCNSLEKKIDDQVNIKFLLDDVMNEKKQLELVLNEKNYELNAEKGRYQALLEKACKSESMEGELRKKSQSYENVLQEKFTLQKQLDETNAKIAELLESLQQEKLNLQTLSERIPDLEIRLLEYQQAIDDTLVEREDLQNQLKAKTDELNQQLAENDALNRKLQELRLNQTTSDENLVTLKNQKDELLHLFEVMEKEHGRLLAELEGYKSLLEDLDSTKNDYDRIKNENGNLKNQLKIVEMRNNDHISALVADNKQLEIMLLEAREEVVRGLELPERSLYQSVKDQVKALEKERHESHAEIRQLKDQQDANENLISELKGELLSRDERISILENHINLLQDEIIQLHKNLADGVSASEQLQGQAFEGFDNSIKKIEAHHSKAFHNMKMELDQLEKEKTVLQEQLYNTKNLNEKSIRDNKTYLTKIAELKNERAMMFNEIKKLEHTTIGSTGLLTDDDSDIQSVKESFSRISSNLEASKSQSAALESKLHIVKNTSEELLSKTNEAKKIAENEKQKLKLEKEKAVRERNNLEKQMQDLEIMFKRQRDDDVATIEDLRKEILNQELLIKEVKDSTQEYIQKINDELETLQNLYKNSQTEITDLKAKLQDSHRENSDYKDKNKKLNETIENYNEILQKNYKEMAELNQNLKVKPKGNAETQTKIETKDSSTKSPKELNTKQQIDISENKFRVQEKIPKKQDPENITKFAENLTELQIINANVQPTLDFVKNTYTKYKQSQLRQGSVEQHSILSLVEPTNKQDSDENQLRDIYNRKSLVIEESQYDKINNTNQSVKTNTIETIKNNKQNVSSDRQSNDEDVFVIYTSSETVLNKQPSFSIPDSSISNKNSGNEENYLTLNQTDLEKGFDDGKNKHFTENLTNQREGKTSQRDRKSERDAKIKKSASDEGFALTKKHKPNDPLLDSIEYAGKSSQSSYNGNLSQQILLHSSDTDDDKLKRKETQSKSNLSLNENKLETEDFFDNLSNDQDNHFKLNRVDGESIIFKDKHNKITHEISEHHDNLGLNFILETAKQETQHTFDYNNTNSLRRSQSAESFYKNSSQTGQGNSFAAINRQQIVSHSIIIPLKNKKVANKEVSVNIEPIPNSRETIEQLTAALDNSEKDYKKKLEAIKAQYDANIKRIINEHNEGVKNLQNLHEDMVNDLVKKHENEVENLRSLSFEAIKRAEKMEKENKLLKNRFGYNENYTLDQEPVEIESRFRVRDARLSKTTIESFDVKPRMRHSGPCTCSLDVNVSDTIRNIFDQVDQDQRKLAEFTYVKYIAHKMMSGNVDALDSQELAFLHYNVCRHWKVKQNIEDTLRKKIDSLETELISKQRHAQQHIAELDRRVAEERRRLQEVREAVGYQPVPGVSLDMQPDRDSNDVGRICTPAPPPPPPRNLEVPCSPIRVKKVRPDSHYSERRVARPQQPQNHSDEMPTRLRRCCQDRSAKFSKK